MTIVNGTRILAGVVTFHPPFGRLRLLIERLLRQVDEVLIVDNTPGGADWSGAGREVRNLVGKGLRVLGHNTGIAAAQNLAIEHAVNERFDYLLFSDQDSVPEEDMVAGLLGVAMDLAGSGVRVGSVCPAYFDETSGQLFRFQVLPLGKLFYRSVAAAEADPWIEVVTSISSGSLVPCQVLRQVGGMREDFFIDDVDTEWCHRARAQGFRHFGTVRARLSHSLGDAPIRVWYFGWRVHSQYSPVRLYYRFRNYIRMIRLPHVPWNWSLRAGWYWLGNVYVHCVFAKDRLRNGRAIALGVWHGLRGRGGAADRVL